MKKYRRITIEFEEGNIADILKAIFELNNIKDSLYKENKVILNDICNQIIEKTKGEINNVQRKD